MKLHTITFTLAMIGALNWGLVGIGNWMGSNWNVVNILLGAWPMVENIVYILVGLSAVQLVIAHKDDCKHCDTGMPGMGMKM